MWIESHEELRNHPKVMRLARLLDTSIPAAIGHLHCFWWWAMRYAEDGKIGEFHHSELARAAEWTGDADSFVRAMIDCRYRDHLGFLEETGEGLIIHNWHRYIGKLLDKRAEDRERKRRAKETQQDIRNNSAGNPSEIQRNSDGNLTEGAGKPKPKPLPKQEPKQEPKDLKTLVRSATARASAKDKEFPEEFVRFWEIYPRQINMLGAYKAWVKCLKQGASAEDITTAARHYAESCQAKNTETQFIMHPTTFLGRDQRWTEYAHGIPQETKTSYDRARESGPRIGGRLGRLLGETDEDDAIDVESREVSEDDDARLERLFGVDTGYRRTDDGQAPV